MTTHRPWLYVIVQDGPSAFHIILPNLWGNIFLRNSVHFWDSNPRFTNRPDMSRPHPRTKAMEEFDSRGIGWVPSTKCAAMEDDLEFITTDLVDAKCQIARNTETIEALHNQIRKLEDRIAKYESKQRKSKRLKQDDSERPQRDAASAMLGYADNAEQSDDVEADSSQSLHQRLRGRAIDMAADGAVWNALVSLLDNITTTRSTPQANPPSAVPPF